MADVMLYVDRNGDLYVRKDDGPLWALGPVTPDMYARFGQDAHAWVKGAPSPRAGAQSTDEPPSAGDLRVVAVCNVGDLGYAGPYRPPPYIVRTIEAANPGPAAWRYVHGREL